MLLVAQRSLRIVIPLEWLTIPQCHCPAVQGFMVLAAQFSGSNPDGTVPVPVRWGHPLRYKGDLQAAAAEVQEGADSV